MRIAEPMTLLTDWALGVLALTLAFPLFDVAAAGGQVSVRLWAMAFVLTAAAAFLGGAHHGFSKMLPSPAGRVLWTITLATTGFGSACLLGAAIMAATAGSLRWALLAVVVLKLLVYVEVVASRDNFLLVVADSGSALLAILLAAIVLRPTGLTPGAAWVMAGVAASVVAGIVQALRLAPHPTFNHNDAFHVIQMVALYLLYRGGRLFLDMR